MFFLYSNLKLLAHNALSEWNAQIFNKGEDSPFLQDFCDLRNLNSYYSIVFIIWFESKECKADILDDVIKAKLMLIFSVSDYLQIFI